MPRNSSGTPDRQGGAPFSRCEESQAPFPCSAFLQRRSLLPFISPPFPFGPSHFPSSKHTYSAAHVAPPGRPRSRWLNAQASSTSVPVKFSSILQRCNQPVATTRMVDSSLARALPVLSAPSLVILRSPILFLFLICAEAAAARHAQVMSSYDVGSPFSYWGPRLAQGWALRRIY